jgi:hypothetical protein
MEAETEGGGIHYSLSEELFTLEQRSKKKKKKKKKKNNNNNIIGKENNSCSSRIFAVQFLLCSCISMLNRFLFLDVNSQGFFLYC